MLTSWSPELKHSFNSNFAGDCHDDDYHDNDDNDLDDDDDDDDHDGDECGKEKLPEAQRTQKLSNLLNNKFSHYGNVFFSLRICQPSTIFILYLWPCAMLNEHCS